MKPIFEPAPRHFLDPKDVRPRYLGQVLSVWQTAALEHMPGVEDLDFTALQPFLGHLALVEMDDEGARFALFGPNLKVLLGQDGTGKRVREMFPPAIAEDIETRYREALTTRSPVLDERTFSLFGLKLGYHRLAMPLARGRDGKGRLLLAIFPMPASLSRATQWRGLLKLASSKADNLDSWLAYFGHEEEGDGQEGAAALTSLMGTSGPHPVPATSEPEPQPNPEPEPKKAPAADVFLLD